MGMAPGLTSSLRLSVQLRVHAPFLSSRTGKPVPKTQARHAQARGFPSDQARQSCSPGPAGPAPPRHSACHTCSLLRLCVQEPGSEWMLRQSLRIRSPPTVTERGTGDRAVDELLPGLGF